MTACRWYAVGCIALTIACMWAGYAAVAALFAVGGMWELMLDRLFSR